MKDEDKTREELLTDLQRIRIDMAGMVEAEAFRRRAERELEQVTYIAAAIVRSSPCGLLVLQRQLPDRLLLVNANPQAARLMGRTLDDQRGTDFENLWPEALKQGLTGGFFNALDTGEEFRKEDAVYRSESEDRLLGVHAFPLPEDRVGVYLYQETVSLPTLQEIGTAETKTEEREEPLSDDPLLDAEGLTEDITAIIGQEDIAAATDEDLTQRVEELSRQVEELSAQLLSVQEELAQETELRFAAEEAVAAATRELEDSLRERTEELATATQSLERKLAESQDQEESLRTIQYQLEERLKIQENELRELTEALEVEIEEHKKTEESLVTARVALESRMSDVDEELESANELLKEQLAERRRIESDLRSSIVERELFIHELSTRLSEATECLDRETAQRTSMGQSMGEPVASLSMQHSQLGYAMFDINGELRAFNSRLLDMFGTPSGDDLQGFNLLNAPAMQETGVTEVAQLCLETGMCSTHECPFLDASGEHSVVRVNLAPVRQDHEEIIGCEAIFEDVSSDCLKFEQQLRSERLHALSCMAGSVADTFTDLVQTFSENTQAALTCVESASLSDMPPILETMLGRCRDLGRTARRIRQFARMRPRKDSGQSHLFDLSDVAKEGIDMDALWSKPATTEGGTDVVVEPILTPGCYIEGVEDDFIEVMANLLENAVEALPLGGKILVKTSFGHDEVVLIVRDEGAGIARNHMPKLFDPFWTTKDGHDGLGLCVVFSIVRRHLGTLTIHSEEGVGTTVTVRLPRRTKPTGEEILAGEEPEQGNYRILLWYDFGPVARMIRNKLTRLGYSVFVAQSIQEGLEVLKRARIDAIVIDFSEEDASLPDVIGAIGLQHMQTGLPKPPIIILTASLENGSLAKLFDCPDLSRIVEKPVSVGRLVDIVTEEVKDADSNYPKMSW